MDSTKNKRITVAIDVDLWDRFVTLAKQAAVPPRSLLEKALCEYVQRTFREEVRPHVMKAFEKCVARNRDLLKRLAE